MRAIVPQIGDAMAARHAKGVVRKLKHLKELSRNGALFDDFELDNIACLLGKRPASLGEGRAALYRAAGRMRTSGRRPKRRRRWRS